MDECVFGYEYFVFFRRKTVNVCTPWTSYFDDSEEIQQDGKVLIKLSDRRPVYIVPDIYREKVYINICEYTLKKPRKVADSSSKEEKDESLKTGESRL